jgi:hypothetical protein
MSLVGLLLKVSISKLFSSNRLLGFIGAVPPPARNKSIRSMVNINSLCQNVSTNLFKTKYSGESSGKKSLNGGFSVEWPEQKNYLKN